MKKTLLFAAIGFTAFAQAQVIVTENFDAYFPGNVGTDITGVTPSNGVFTIATNGTAPTTATNAANENFQVVETGNAEHVNALQIIGTNGDKGSRNLWPEVFPELWAERTAGNNIVEAEFDFYTGTPGESKNRFGLYIYDITRTKILAGYSFDSSTLVISGVAYFTNASAPIGNYLFYLGTGATNITLTANTWVKVGVSFNKTTGQILWRGPGWNGQVNGAATATDPDRTSFVSLSGTTTTAPIVTNTAAATLWFDNINIRATATDTLLGVEDVTAQNTAFTLFPNPASQFINVRQDGASIESVTITDINGRTVKQMAAGQVSELAVPVGELQSGVYMINVKSAQGNAVRKFVKQ